MDTNSSATDTAVRQTIEGFYGAVAHKDMGLLRQVVTPDCQSMPTPAGLGTGPDLMVPIFAALTSALPDMDIKILDVLIHGYKVAVRAEVTGTQSGPLMGIAATSRRVDFAIHSFHELRDGKIARTWHLEDWLTVFRQLGELPTNLPWADRP